MRALSESPLAENTLTMFLSDNGIALPFAKTNCYLHSTRTPWIARWPGKIKPGTVDNMHFISGIDFMPTVLDAAGIAQTKGMDGFSFLPTLLGKRQANRDKVFTQHHQTSGRNRYPIRCIQNHKFGYIFNPWSDNERVFKNESQSGLTFKAMQAAAKTNPKIAARVKLFQYRAVEEFYDFAHDPDALLNLSKNPKYKKELDKMRKELLNWMERTNDSAFEALENCSSQEALKKFMAEQDAKSGKKKTKKRTSRNKLLTK
jgi:N-sulfoglucosamine sulfohydrolase